MLEKEIVETLNNLPLQATSSILAFLPIQYLSQMAHGPVRFVVFWPWPFSSDSFSIALALFLAVA